MSWRPFLRLSLWYEVEEAKNNCHEAKQKNDIHPQKDNPTNIILHRREGGGERGVLYTWCAKLYPSNQ